VSRLKLAMEKIVSKENGALGPPRNARESRTLEWQYPL
jgi:hypothetical protein